jgi:acetyl-CoA carboxylase biotin carboxyl carrier protein
VADPKKLRAEATALVTELLERLRASDVRELEVRRGELRVRVAKAASAEGSSSGGAGAAVAGDGPRPSPDLPRRIDTLPVRSVKTIEITAPLTGVFYRSPSPQAPPFVQVGSTVAVGDIVGLIEAMKLFNEIRSTAAGRVVRVNTENGQLVRAHQPLVELE